MFKSLRCRSDQLWFGSLRTLGGSQAKPVLALHWVCRCCRGQGSCGDVVGPRLWQEVLQPSLQAPCGSTKSNAFGSFFWLLQWESWKCGVARVCNEKKGIPPPAFSSIPVFWEEAVRRAAVAAPGVAVLQGVPVCSTVLAGLVNRGSKLELERCAREGGCRLSWSGSGEHRSRPWQPGTVPRLDKPPHLLFFFFST